MFVVHVQETINEYAALYIGAAALFCSASIFVPFIKRFIEKPRIKAANEVSTDLIATINYVSL